MTIAQQLNITHFPFEIKSPKGRIIYREKSDGYWYRHEFNKEGNITYTIDSLGGWHKYTYDERGNEIRYENSAGGWVITQWDNDNTIISQVFSPAIPLD